ncbi:MAG: hypothetical protein FWB76_01645 [Oscillospiraceae bacterium]|nr:hypothetical protein [Oscillospiraceae bacterium]
MLKRMIGLALGLLVLAGCGRMATLPVVDEPATETTEYITTTTEATTTEESTTAVPREWPGVPHAYWEILNSPGNFPSPAAGFALADINGDGVVELVMVTRQGWGEHIWLDLVGLFTQRDGQAYNLAFGGSSRFGFSIAADGTIVFENRVNDGSFTSIFVSERLEPHAVETIQLTGTTTFSRWHDDGTVTRWYHNMQDVLREVTEEQYEAIQRRYQVANPMQFDVTWFEE